MQKQRILSIAMILGVGLTFAPAVAAAFPWEVRKEAVEARREIQQEVRETKREVREEVREARRDFREELRERIGSIPGLMRSFLGKRAVIVHGEVTAKTDGSLTVKRDDKSYTVLVGTFEKCQTKLIRRFWGRADLAEISVGDKANVVGFWQDEEKTTIEACLIRDLSIQKRFGVFVGTVVSLTSSGWVMDPVGSRPNQTVTVSAETEFVNRDGKPISQADIQVGHRVRVKGLWNMMTNTLTEATHVKDYSLPPRPTPLVTPGATTTP